jgi:hypothetical protein
MRKLKLIASVILLLTFFINVVKAQDASLNSGLSAYSVKRASQAVDVNDKWSDAVWKGVESVKIQNYMGEIPKFKPQAEAKMVYDDNFIYVIYRVKDRYVRSITQKINGKVWEDSAVEFFFSPEANNPMNYFNLEINCGGTPLLFHKKGKPTIEDIQKIEIAASLPKVVDPEITKRVTWTMSFKIPLVMLEKYTNVVRPKAGVSWRANFYKIAEINSNKHYITWNVVKNPTPQFHLPQYFGVLNFQ